MRPLPRDVVDDELHEVLGAIVDDDFFDGVGGQFSWPGCLPRRAVALESRPDLAAQ